MAKVRVPVWGTVGKSVRIDPDATTGAQIGVDLRLPDGTVPTLSQLAIALGVRATAPSSPTGGLSPTIWSLISEIPANVIQVQNIATNGLVVRKADGTWVTRDVVAGSAKITVADGDGDAGAPTVDFGVVDLDDLNLVSVVAPMASDVLIFDGAGWVNDLLNFSDLDGLLAADMFPTSLTLSPMDLVIDGFLAADSFTVTVGPVTLPSESIADAALSANVALLDRSPQTFTGDQIISSGTPRLTFSETDGPPAEWSFVAFGAGAFGIQRLDGGAVNAIRLFGDGSGTITEVELNGTLLDLNGIVEIAGASVIPLRIQSTISSTSARIDLFGSTATRVGLIGMVGTSMRLWNDLSQAETGLTVTDSGGTARHAVRVAGGTSSDTHIGFYETAPIAKQTGVAVSAAGIHAALVNLGLIT